MRQNSMIGTWAFYAVAIVASLMIIWGGWIVSSYFEAEAFRRVTGKDVSTWDAMWIELRVQEATR